MAKSMPPAIEVRSANERGSSTSWSPNFFAASGPSITVQSIRTFWELTPDHSTKATAMRLLRPAVMASSTRLSAMAAA